MSATSRPITTATDNAWSERTSWNSTADSFGAATSAPCGSSAVRNTLGMEVSAVETYGTPSAAPTETGTPGASSWTRMSSGSSTLCTVLRKPALNASLLSSPSARTCSSVTHSTAPGRSATTWRTKWAP